MDGALKKFLIGILSLNYPYTNAELLKLAKSQGHKVRMADIRATTQVIAEDILAGRLRRDEYGVLETV